ncbi:hypothetical protein RUM43_011677 [Polyplax serrata]|uniref:Uncharacterized protein n=1 Tax=Polyplax serrata TaxID=468196 RepID=A0AAN8NU55_POLSC
MGGRIFRLDGQEHFGKFKKPLLGSTVETILLGASDINKNEKSIGSHGHTGLGVKQITEMFHRQTLSYKIESELSTWTCSPAKTTQPIEREVNAKRCDGYNFFLASLWLNDFFPSN